MADKRINALANTASSTASDDFIAVDGTTNGTRKLNAFSPTFGGNATVTGTLTVNGTGNNSFAGQLIQVADPATIALWKDATPTKAARFQFNTLADNGFSLGVYDGSSWFNAITVAPTTGVVKVPSTSASTTTSTGALVVSGGVGVAGAINVAGNATVFGASGITINNVGGAGTDSVLTLSQSGVSLAFIKNTATTGDIAIGDGGGTYLRITKAVGVVSVLNSTASTTTSSGALVVSGGVGVAGAIVTGGIVRCGGTNGLSLGSDTGNIRIDSAGPAGVEFRGLSAADTISGFTMREMALIDGTSAPSTRAGYATIYVDSADGDLKVKFGDGTVKTIATDS